MRVQGGAAHGALSARLTGRTRTCMQLLRRHTLLDECRILLVHGLLHLLGYDHEAGAEGAAAMERAECLVLRRLGWRVRSGLGIPNVYQMRRRMAKCFELISTPRDPQTALWTLLCFQYVHTCGALSVWPLRQGWDCLMRSQQ